MACLASAMVSLVGLYASEKKAQDLLRDALEGFSITYAQKWQDLFRKKLGFATEDADDIVLIEQLLQAMHDSRVDFTNLFRSLGEIKIDTSIDEISLRHNFIDRAVIDQWFFNYIARLRKECSNDSVRKTLMHQVNPKYVLRNHLAQNAIELAQKKDYSEVIKLLDILGKPFDEQPENESYALSPSSELQVVEVSCSP